MDKKQLITLHDLAVEKWIEVTFYEKIDKGGNDCAFCKTFQMVTFTGIGNCTKCPIRVKTNMHMCFDTPYGAWCDLFEEEEPYQVNNKERYEAALSELLFLVDLHPIEEKRKYYLGELKQEQSKTPWKN